MFWTAEVGILVGEGLFVRDNNNKEPFKWAQVKKEVHWEATASNFMDI